MRLASFGAYNHYTSFVALVLRHRVNRRVLVVACASSSMPEGTGTCRALTKLSGRGIELALSMVRHMSLHSGAPF